MKLGIVLSAQPSSFSALLYEGKMEENITKIKKLGYDGVELAVRDPEQLNVEWLKSILERSQMNVPAIQTGQVYLEEGLSFVNPDPAIRKKAIERIKSQVRLSKALDTLVIIGLVRGKKTREISAEKQDAWLRDALWECAQENESVKLAIEPINRYETDIINTVASGLNLVERIDMRNVGLLLDTFHMNIEEPSIVESIVSAKDHLFHFHIADSNRWYPGAGHINFNEIFSTLNQINYQGFVSAEIVPVPDPDSAAKKTIEYMSQFKVLPDE
jgi:sugar phosphate isomerase/epimerase